VGLLPLVRDGVATYGPCEYVRRASCVIVPDFKFVNNF
jgi:hypothetical protein